MSESRDTQTGILFRIGRVVWICVLVVLCIRWWRTREPPRWFEILLPIAMLGNSFSVARVDTWRTRGWLGRMIPSLILLSGALVLAGRLYELFVP